jgi:glycosyltransferase involved in cell wall biosynthesis
MERVLFVVNAEEFGGLEVVLLDWLSGIDYSKVSVALCYRSDVLKQKLALLNLPVETIKLNFPAGAGESSWKAFWSWRGVFSKVQPGRIILMEGNVGDLGLAPVLAARFSASDVYIHAGGGGAAADAANPASGATKLHAGISPGFGFYRTKQALKQKIRSSSLTRNFVPSQGLKDNVVRFLGYPASQTSVLYHGVDPARFQPSAAERAEYRRANAIPDDAIVIVSHGRIAPIKRVDRILKAFAILSADHPNLWLLLTCYGPLKSEIERTVASSAAYRQVKLLGFQDDSSKLLKSADIYALASDREGFGIALVEAMSTGLVCVATNCQGPAEIIVNGENGILVEPTDEEVSSGLKKALALTREARSRLVANARKTAEGRFEIQAAVRTALNSMGIPSR